MKASSQSQLQQRKQQKRASTPVDLDVTVDDDEHEEDQDVSDLFSGSAIVDETAPDDEHDYYCDATTTLPQQQYCDAQEVTREQHLQQVAAASAVTPPASFNRTVSRGDTSGGGIGSAGNLVAQKITSFMRSSSRLQRQAAASADSSSVGSSSDNATAQSVEGLQSIATNITVSSKETVKASNMTEEATTSKNEQRRFQGQHQGDGNKGKPSSRRWNKLKSIVGGVVKPVPENATLSDSSLGRSSARPGSDIKTGDRCGSNHSKPDSQKQRARSGGSSASTISMASSNASAVHCPPISSQSLGSASVNGDEIDLKKLDRSIRGQMDGLDVLWLGPARFMSLGPEPVEHEPPPQYELKPSSSSLSSSSAKQQQRRRQKSLLPWDDTPYTFTGRPITITPAEMVSTMLRRNSSDTANDALPIVVLEGFIPGCDDRWRVCIEDEIQRYRHHPSLSRKQSHGKDDSRNRAASGSSHSSGNTSSICGNRIGSDGGIDLPSLAPAFTQDDAETSEEDGSSPVIPTHKMWPKLWGSEQQKPFHSLVSLDWMEEDDPLLHLAAEHSIPIDLDESTFCVSEREHLETVRSFVSVSLAAGRFPTAGFILGKLLKGVEQYHHNEEEVNPCLKYVKGATLHNIGVLLMWQGEFEKAVEYFHLAIQERTLTLPKDHPDIAVSMVRKGMSQFALGRFDDALFAMELAIGIYRNDEIARSKILTNMGVIRFQQRNFKVCSELFESSLKIQRRWLEGKLRRDGIVFDASTTLSNMGKLHIEEVEYNEAYYVYEEALLLQTSIFRKDHELVLSSLQSLAIARAHDSMKKAIQILQGCLRSQNTRFGKDSPESIETIAMMGFLYEALECNTDALKRLTTVRKWQKANNLPNDNPAVEKTRRAMARIEERLGKNASAWI